METLIPILANILAPAILDFLFGSDESGAGHYKGIIAKIGYPRLEKHLEYFIAKNFPDIYKIALEKQKQRLETPDRQQPEKMTFYGYDYRCPSLEGQPMEEITYKTKRGTRTKRYPKPTPEWEAVYELNKQQAANNSWIKFLRSKMPELKKEYYAEKAGTGLRGLKGRYYASKISPEIEKLSKDELLKIYYGKRAPRRRRKALPAPVVEEVESQAASGYFY